MAQLGGLGLGPGELADDAGRQEGRDQPDDADHHQHLGQGIAILAADVEAFSSDVQRYPTQSEGLKALVQQPDGAEGWSGPYIRDQKMLNDPWGQPIVYAVDTDKRVFTITSLGADGKPGGTGVNRDLQAPENAGSGAALTRVAAPVSTAQPAAAQAASTP